MSTLLRPYFALSYKGIDISSTVRPQLISCTYTDHLEGKADEIEVTVQDREGLWRGDWCPEQGDTVSLDSIGYEGGVTAPGGIFQIDEPAVEITRSGDTFSFRGTSVPITQSLRTKKTKGFDNKSLSDITKEVAGEHGLTVMGTPPDVSFERVTQRRERPLEFLTRKAAEFGAYCVVKNCKDLVFMPFEEVHARPAVRTFSAAEFAPSSEPTADQVFVRCSLRRQNNKTYSKAKATHYHGQQKKTIEYEYEDKAVKNGDTLRIDDRLEDEGQAEKRSKAELTRENRKKLTGTIVVVGDPLLMAGNVIALGEGFGKWAGRYVINQSRHTTERKGYTTDVEIYGI